MRIAMETSVCAQHEVASR